MFRAILALALATLLSAQCFAAAEDGLTSRKEHGIVRLMTDPSPMNGRLILKVVAFNSTDDPSNFSGDDIRLFTPSGKAVHLISLERLIDEAREAAGVRGSAHDMSGVHDPSNYSHPQMVMNGVGGGGKPYVDRYTGAVNPTSGVVSSHTQVNGGAPPEKYDQTLQQDIAALNAAILQPLVIPPSQAGGGEIVTERVKFARNEEHTLRVIVAFNGEQHEFSLAVPASH
ncbi:MAG TPA: hypothetical protein VE046_02915 [Steroidobacteraceae bacterium]|nr:hypothetical protein [Steroidobacteraceae bacterium]